MSYDAMALTAQLWAAGLHKQDIISGCNSDGAVFWQPGHPTAEEGALAEAVLAAYVAPGPRDADTELGAAIAAAATLEELKAALLGEGGAAKVKGRLP